MSSKFPPRAWIRESVSKKRGNSFSACFLRAYYGPARGRSKYRDEYLSRTEHDAIVEDLVLAVENLRTAQKAYIANKNAFDREILGREVGAMAEKVDEALAKLKGGNCDEKKL